MFNQGASPWYAVLPYCSENSLWIETVKSVLFTLKDEMCEILLQGFSGIKTANKIKLVNLALLFLKFFSVYTAPFLCCMVMFTNYIANI